MLCFHHLYLCVCMCVCVFPLSLQNALLYANKDSDSDSVVGIIGVQIVHWNRDPSSLTAHEKQSPVGTFFHFSQSTKMAISGLVYCVLYSYTS